MSISSKTLVFILMRIGRKKVSLMSDKAARIVIDILNKLFKVNNFGF